MFDLRMVAQGDILREGDVRYWTEPGQYPGSQAEIVRANSVAQKALVLYPAGHTVEHLEETGIAQSMRCIMLQDRLSGVGVKEAEMEILDGVIPGNDAIRQRNLERAYQLGREF
jgi:putative NADPH-quinone reductase